MAQLHLYDEFQDIDFTFLNSHTPNIGTWSGATTSYFIDSARLVADTTFPGIIYGIRSNDAPGGISFNFRRFASSSFGIRIYFAYPDTTTYFSLAGNGTNTTNTGNLVLNGAVVQTKNYGSAFTAGINYGFILSISGNTVTIQIAGLSDFIHTDGDINPGLQIGLNMSTSISLDGLSIYSDSNPSSNNFTMFMKGRDTHSDTRPLYTAGNYEQKKLNLYTKNVAAINKGLTLYTVAETHSGDASIPLYTLGAVLEDLNSEAPLFIEGHDIAVSSVPLYVGGKVVQNNSIPLYMDGRGFIFSSSIPMYVKGISSDVETMPLFVKVKEVNIDNNNTILYTVGSTPGITQLSKSSPLFIADNADPYANLNLYIGGYSQLRSLNNNTNLYVKGHVPSLVNSGVSMFMFNQQGTENSGIPMYIFSTIPTAASSGTPMYINSHGTTTGVSKLYVNGY